ncbi:FGGY family carbohydrate kinase [Nocardioides stalactiti]|uniref:FGGY family carbohydrate kinase n=1 Tax=Nocardioides stalactiti TaxID=2755356 RepID=UPI0028AE30D8|nr:FGGY family carbohydrate kinase [Nocardioides stalactiti]
MDSSTQSTKAVLVDADDGTVVAQRSAPHPPGTEVDPGAWLDAVDAATAGLLDQAAAVAVAGQQHGLVALDGARRPVRDALLWNDTRSAPQAAALVEEMGGPQACADAIGSVLVASFTSTKLRWLRDHEPASAERVAEVLLPHDYVSLHLAAPGTAPFTDRGDASGTGYLDARSGAWRTDLLVAALGHEARLPTVVAPGSAAGATRSGALLAGGTGDNMGAALGHEARLPTVVAPGSAAGATRSGALLAGGTGDNMGAALGLDLTPADVLVSIGTSGVASTIAAHPVADGTGTVTGFADARGAYLPMVTTMNAAGILDLQARWLGVDHDGLAALALESPSGAGGVTLSPYYGGERTPNRPDAVGTWTGLTPATTRADLARASYEALLCSLADAVDALVRRTGVQPARVLLVGGAARSAAVQALAPGILGRDVVLPAPGEYVARGAARQAAWALSGAAEPPAWPVPTVGTLAAPPEPEVRARYAALRDLLDPR